MSIYIWDKEIKDLCIWDRSVKEVYLWDAKVRPTSRLPSEYQEVEYIGGTGTQYINTGLEIEWWYIINCKTQFPSFSGNNKTLWGYWGYSWGVYHRLYWGATTSAQRQYWFLDWYTGWTWSVSVNTDYELELSTVSWNLYFKVDGTTIGSKNYTYSHIFWWNICVLAGYTSPQYYPRVWKIYSFKVYDSSNTLVRDLVPCYRKSDTVIWMYDLVNNVFYTNSWTWTFSKWQDVS